MEQTLDASKNVVAELNVLIVYLFSHSPNQGPFQRLPLD